MFKFKIIKKNEYEDMQAYIKILEGKVDLFKTRNTKLSRMLKYALNDKENISKELEIAKKVISDLKIENDELRRGQEALKPKTKKTTKKKKEEI